MIVCITVKTVKKFTKKSTNVVASIFKKSVFNVSETLLKFFFLKCYEAGEPMLSYLRLYIFLACVNKPLKIALKKICIWHGG